MEDEINDFGIASMFWEEFYQKHIKDLTFFMKEYSENAILEFENIDDLRAFVQNFFSMLIRKLLLIFVIL